MGARFAEHSAGSALGIPQVPAHPAARFWHKRGAGWLAEGSTGYGLHGVLRWAGIGAQADHAGTCTTGRGSTWQRPEYAVVVAESTDEGLYKC